MPQQALVLLLAVTVLAPMSSSGQASKALPGKNVSASEAASKTGPSYRDLTLINTLKSSYVNAGMLLGPLKCDRSGNFYLRNLVDGVPGIHKLSANGQQSAVCLAGSAAPDLDVRRAAGYFSVANDGRVYQLVSPWNVRKHHVFVYGPDGAIRSYIRLETGFPWIPAQVTAVGSGSLIVTGSEYDIDRKAAKWPFTGLFSSDGKLLREIKLQDDGAIHDMAAAGDPRVVSPEAPTINHAVGLGELEIAGDGNAYLMRRLSPAIVYAISPSGDVLRRFTVEADQDYMPESMHISGNKIAVQFQHPQTTDQLIKVVDLEGRELATYHVGTTSPLGSALVCYSSDPERLTFLGDMGENETLTLNIAASK